MAMEEQQRPYCGVAMPTKMVPIAGCEIATRVAASVTQSDTSQSTRTAAPPPTVGDEPSITALAPQHAGQHRFGNVSPSGDGW
jgi:hypothetical protein